MPVKVMFLGKLADKAGDEVELDGPLDWTALLSGLEPELAEAVKGDSVKLAHNGNLMSDKATLAASDGDEIALLPPVSGG